MLDNYYGVGMSDKSTFEQRQRLLAVQAALEIAKVAAGVTCGGSHASVDIRLQDAADKIDVLADAIQKALNT